MGRAAACSRARKRLNKRRGLPVGEIGQRIEIVLPAEKTRKEIQDIVEIDVDAGLQSMRPELIAEVVDALIAMLSCISRAEIVPAERDHRSTLIYIGLRVIRIGSGRLAVPSPLKARLVHYSVRNHRSHRKRQSIGPNNGIACM